MARRLLLFSSLFVMLLGAIPLAASAQGGMWRAPVSETTSATSPGVVITATLTEYHIALEPAQPKIKVGQHVLFIIHNAGKLAHEFMIMSDQMAGMQGMTMGQMDAMSVATVEPDQLHPGATVKLNVTFADPGTFRIACHLPGHEAMKASITVSA
jgi:uncharacterized cupredoxin-like copper-binding protein